MNFANNKKKKKFVIRNWLYNGKKRKHQYWVRDVFIDKTDSQYNKLLRKLRTNDLEFHYKWVVTPFTSASASIFSASISVKNVLQRFDCL